MPEPKTYQDIFLALFLSLILTLFIGVLLVLYPLVSSFLLSMLGYPDSNPGSTVRVSKSDLKVLLIQPILFVLIFDRLQKRGARPS
jgi:hypothetical protein